MVTVCIFELRNAMRTVQQAFNISSLGTSHTVPEISKEVQILTKALEENKIQEYTIERPSNEHIKPVRDLLEQGSQYPDSRSAFHMFRPDQRIPVNLGIVELTVSDGTSPEDKDVEESHQEEYEITREDLALDKDETYEGMDSAIDNMMIFLDSDNIDSI